MIPVTKTFLPPIEEYEDLLKGIWHRNWLTNNGPVVNELELKLKEYLQVPNFLYTSNGTIALQMAIKALDLKGEVITTPFSFVATTSAIVWEGCHPVMVDIDPYTFNIDASKIEGAITPNTSAILATHVFGNACDIEKIDAIAQKYNLKVIYDAAHCFGTKYKGQSIFSFGDVSVTSFHASKLYHTTEGGGIFTNDSELLRKLALMRNFGFDGPENFACLGINAKNSEFHAAMGIVNLKYIDRILKKRKTDYIYYSEKLKSLDIQEQKINPDTESNYSYYPVVFQSEKALKRAESLLKNNWIFPRRYFYPPLHTLNYIQQVECESCLNISKRILCLPIYYDLKDDEKDLIINLLHEAQNN